MKHPTPDLAELMKSEEFQQRYAKIKEQMEAMQAVKDEEKGIVLMFKALDALKRGDRPRWRRRMKRACELCRIDPAKYGV
ncbi:MAG TPA: hypothetical protein VHS06_11915 [Chloroflexota bacterium]|nr:hypothetical protein [Chloroflexota bacterium]